MSTRTFVLASIGICVSVRAAFVPRQICDFEDGGCEVDFSSALQKKVLFHSQGSSISVASDDRNCWVLTCEATKNACKYSRHCCKQAFSKCSRRRRNQPSENVQVLYEWVSLDYLWSHDERTAAIRSGNFKPENCIMCGIKVCGPYVSESCKSELVFVTVPRWAPGVPATLNMVVQNRSKHNVLLPWPSLEVQDPSSCNNIQNVQSMEIDPSGTMWVVDVGRKYFVKGQMDNSCPPKMVLIDVPTGKIISIYVFPPDVVTYSAPETSPGGAYLNDIVLDVGNQVAYISDMGGNGTDNGGIVVYNRLAGVSRRFTDMSTQGSLGAVIFINGYNYSSLLGGFATDGLALTPDGAWLFYTQLGDFRLRSLDAKKLRTFTDDFASVSASVVYHSSLPSNADGMTMDNQGLLYFGGRTTNALYSWNPSMGPVSDSPRLATSEITLFWIDTFSWSNNGYLFMTSNKLCLWFFGNPPNSTPGAPIMDFTGSSGPNFRILKKLVCANSYMSQSTKTVCDL